MRTEKETADLSATLRSGRDDKVVLGKLRLFQSMTALKQVNNLVISTGAQRSGEICGFLLVLTQTLQPLRFFAMLFSVMTKNARALLKIGFRQRFGQRRAVTRVYRLSDPIRLILAVSIGVIRP